MERPISPRSGPRGFTLIELLVVVAVLAVLSVGATLTLGRGGATASQDMTLFRQIFDQQRAMSITGQQVRGLKLMPRGLFTGQYRTSGWELSNVQVGFSGQAILSARTVVGTPPEDPQIVILPNGQTTPFSVVFSGGGRCETDGWKGLVCDG